MRNPRAGAVLCGGHTHPCMQYNSAEVNTHAQTPGAHRKLRKCEQGRRMLGMSSASCDGVLLLDKMLPPREIGQKVPRTPLYYFIQLHVNLQLFESVKMFYKIENLGSSCNLVVKGLRNHGADWRSIFAMEA